MTKNQKIEAINILERIPFGSRRGVCSACLNWYAEEIDFNKKEYVENGICKKCLKN